MAIGTHNTHAHTHTTHTHSYVKTLHFFMFCVFISILFLVTTLCLCALDRFSDKNHFSGSQEISVVWHKIGFPCLVDTNFIRSPLKHLILSPQTCSGPNPRLAATHSRKFDPFSLSEYPVLSLLEMLKRCGPSSHDAQSSVTHLTGLRPVTPPPAPPPHYMKVR